MTSLQERTHVDAAGASSVLVVDPNLDSRLDAEAAAPDPAATRRRAVGRPGGAVALLFVEALVEGPTDLSATRRDG